MASLVVTWWIVFFLHSAFAFYKYSVESSQESNKIKLTLYIFTGSHLLLNAAEHFRFIVHHQKAMLLIHTSTRILSSTSWSRNLM